MDCQYSCLLLVQSLITPLATSAGTPRADYLISYLVSINPQVCWYPYQLNTVMFLQFQKKLMAVPDSFRIYLETGMDLNGCLTVAKNIDVSACVVLFYVRHYTSFNDTYFSLEHCSTEPKPGAMLLLELHLHTTVPMPTLVLDPSVYQTKPFSISGFNLFCHWYFLGNLAMNSLWYASLSIILSVPICQNGSCSTSPDFLARPKFVDLGFLCWLQINL